MPESFAAFAARMQEQGLHDLQVESFRRHYHRLLSGERGALDRSAIAPVEDLPHLDDLAEIAERRALIDEVAILKLNGGLGTSMGLTGPKSLLELREGLSFLDVLARQVLHARSEFGGRLPLILMNSFNTSEETTAALARYPGLGARELMQSQVPKVHAAEFRPAEWPGEPRLEWNPPGHGDVYLSLYCSGMLDQLLLDGYRWMFLSNVDNLGGGLDLRIPGWMKAEGIPFVMEVADRTAADRKGGHLARLRDGRLVLRESAQCPDDEKDEFQDVARYRYFNTNNLWVDLRALQSRLHACGGVLDLPLIVNAKTLDPRDAGSPRVFQLETAMGAAISVFDGARALRVPRDRFAPVKTTDDLLAVRSDAYVLTEDSEIRLHPDRAAPPTVALDPAWYRLVPGLEARIPQGPPSLRRCASLKVRGDVTFGRDVRCEGDVEVVGPGAVPDGTLLAGRVEL